MMKTQTLVKLLIFFNILLAALIFSSPTLSPFQSSIEFKYVVFSQDQKRSMEFVDKIWINGAPDYNNRPFYFQPGSTVVVKAPETVNTPWGTAKFAFWQKEEGLTFQGQIVSNSTLTVKAWGKQIWWANYVLQP
jgi:hypothetical protein